MKGRTYTLDMLRDRCTVQGNCWIWPLTQDAPIVTSEGRTISARRLAREQVNGTAIPPGCVAIAHCKNRRCISPYCSQIVTQTQAGLLQRLSPAWQIARDKTRRTDGERHVRIVPWPATTPPPHAPTTPAAREHISNPFAGLGARP